jgi:hypothetical protein
MQKGFERERISEIIHEKGRHYIPVSRDRFQGTEGPAPEEVGYILDLLRTKLGMLEISRPLQPNINIPAFIVLRA